MRNNFPSKEQIERQREKFKPGIRVELVSMTDPYATLKPGERGFVSAVDDIGTVFVHWDSGSTLGACYGADEIKVLPHPIPAKVIDQIMEIRKHPQCPNMFEVKAVFELALSLDYDALTDFLFMDTHRYGKFILDGDAG
jgi:hypothetical protein